MQSRFIAVGACVWALALPLAGELAAQEADSQAPTPFADPAELAFEQGRWEEAIAEYREILAAYPEDRLSLLRIAQIAGLFGQTIRFSPVR